jgi:hypothetical protein
MLLVVSLTGASLAQKGLFLSGFVNFAKSDKLGYTRKNIRKTAVPISLPG